MRFESPVSESAPVEDLFPGTDDDNSARDLSLPDFFFDNRGNGSKLFLLEMRGRVCCMGERKSSSNEIKEEK
jgi:hypothetical protein